MLTNAITFLTSRPRIAALLLGASTAFAMPPFGLFPLLFITLPALFYLLADATPRQGFARGFLFAFGYHVLGLYWIASSMLVDVASFWWAIPLAVVALPAYFALYTGLAAATYTVVRNKFTTAGQPFILALVLMIAEIARCRLLTGFEWNLFGQTWDSVPAVLQSVSLFGIHALTFLTLLLTLAPVWWRAGNRRIAASMVLLFVLLGSWGAYRLFSHDTTYQPGIQLRLVQPNIPQDLKWDPALRDENFATTLAMADLSSNLRPSHIIWPEAAVPFMLNAAPDARLQIGLRTPGNGLSLVGTPWRDERPDGRVYHNSMVALNDTGTVVARFDKQHLVPFGEYFPFRALFKKYGFDVSAIAAGANDFTPGDGLRTLALPGLPAFSPLICYEVIFSGRVARDDTRPAWLLNITNDAWFGSTTGPYQHFAIARLRAIEEGVPLVRVANTGISGVIDAYGRVVAHTRLNERVALDHGLPQPTATATPFSTWRFLPLLILMVSALCVAVAFCKKQ